MTKSNLRLLTAAVIVILSTPVLSFADHAVPNTHPRLLGDRAHLQQLAQERPSAYQRMKSVANDKTADDWSRLMSMSLVVAVEQNQTMAREAIDTAMKHMITGPIKVGHTPFGTDLALCGIVYDMCYDYWTPNERSQFITYMNKTVDTNVTSETQVFHNGWYGYKNWGEGIASYATYYENPNARAYLDTLYKDYQTRAVPALEMAGMGGGWAEGYYVHYWSYEWMFFCEVANFCEGKDLYAMAPDFYRNRAVASMFEMYPGISDYGSRRPVPMGDGGGRVFGGDRDKALSARRILVNHFRDDPLSCYVYSYNETTPRSSVGNYAYKDFLWRDTTVTSRDLSTFRLSHISTGPGNVYARSSWSDSAVYFFFKCGDRFTAHQHLDNGHFDIYKNAELAGDGGHYDNFGSVHDVNYHLRTIAHSTMLVYDPAEQWLGATAYSAGIRAGTVTGNDGGQHHSFPNHNGAVADVPAWLADSAVYNIADILAFEDKGPFLYVAGDCSRAYWTQKLNYFTRQIVYVRSIGSFVIFDRVSSKDPSFKKTWQLQAMKVPAGTPPNLTITNGAGRLFVTTLLPQNPQVTLASGAGLYQYDGQNFPPSVNTGPAPECRIGVSPATASTVDYFLHVLTATDTSIKSVTPATVQQSGDEVTATLGIITVTFTKSSVGGRIAFSGPIYTFADSIVTGVAGSSPGGPRSRLLPQPINLVIRSRQGMISFDPGTTIKNWQQAKMRAYDLRGTLVADVKWQRGLQNNGPISWHVRDGKGKPLSPGTYGLQVTVRSPAGELGTCVKAVLLGR